jgi:hypothetical protein
MFQLDFSNYDRACMRAWGISAAADTRTRAEAEARFRVPEWLRRTTWRQFWAEQDAASPSQEQPGCSHREFPYQLLRSFVQRKPGEKF